MRPAVRTAAASHTSISRPRNQRRRSAHLTPCERPSTPAIVPTTTPTANPRTAISQLPVPGPQSKRTPIPTTAPTAAPARGEEKAGEDLDGLLQLRPVAQSLRVSVSCVEDRHRLADFSLELQAIGRGVDRPRPRKHALLVELPARCVQRGTSDRQDVVWREGEFACRASGCSRSSPLPAIGALAAEVTGAACVGANS